MQLRFIEIPQLADTIRDSQFAAYIDSPGGDRIHVIRYGGQDIIAIQGHGELVTVLESDDDGLPSIHTAAAQLLGDMRGDR